MENFSEPYIITIVSALKTIIPYVTQRY